MSSLPFSAEAEQGFIAKLLVDPSHIPTLVGVVEPSDFHDEVLGQAWSVMVDNAGDPRRLDITVLRSRGIDLGDPLVFMQQGQASAESYATIIRTDAVKRRAMLALESAKRMVKGAANEAGVYDAVSSATSTVLSQHRGGTIRTLAEAVADYRPTHGDIAWGMSALDTRIQPLGSGQMIVVAARPNVGKALSLNMPVLTPTGWKKMGDLQVGDTVIGGSGLPCKVTGVYPQGSIPTYLVRMADGGSVEASGDHLWVTRTRNDRRFGRGYQVRTTDEVAQTIERPDGSSPNHSIPVVGLVQYESRSYPKLHPYLMGVLLGDGELGGGNIRITNPELDIQASVTALLPEDDTITWEGMTGRVKRRVRNNKPSTTRTATDEYGLNHNSPDKHLPDDYLYGSPDVRLLTLVGLMDTDGYVIGKGTSVEYTSSSAQLADDVAHLARSLGAIVTQTSRPSHYVKNGVAHQARTSHRLVIRFPNGVRPVSSDKHLAKWRDKPSRRNLRTIQSVTLLGDRECQCITVDDPDRTFVTRDFIVTHNSAFLVELLLGMSRGSDKPVMFTTIEMSEHDVVKRLAFRAGGLGQFSSGYNLLIDDEPRATTASVRARAARVRLQHGGLKAIAVDYLQILKDVGEPDHVRVSRISGECKAIAREFGCPVIVLSQLNRQSESRDDRRPRLADLRDSGAIEQDADIVLGLYRPKLDSSALSLLVMKNRHGPAGGQIEMYFDLASVSVVEE